MLTGHMELPSETRGIAVGQEIVVLTEEEFEALEARKPQVSAEVIARTQGALIGWRYVDDFDAEELLEHGDVLRDATRALLAAVEAVPDAPDEERLTEAEWADRFAELWRAASVPTSRQPLVLSLFSKGFGIEQRGLSGLFLNERPSMNVMEVVRSAADKGEAAPEVEPPRVLRWEGYAEPGPDEGRDVIVRIHCDSIAARRFCGTGKIVHVESAVEASAPTPDFSSMSPDDLSLEEVQALRVWLDERGRLYEGRATGEEVLFHAWFGGGGAVGAGHGSTREAALLALCKAVAAEEAS